MMTTLTDHVTGSAVIEKVTRRPSTSSGQAFYEWHLADVQRATRLRKPMRQPQPVWFRPF